MTNKNKSIRNDAIKLVLFVFVLFAVAEIAAPFFNVKLEDPLAISGFVTGIIGYLIRPREKSDPHILVIKESDMSEVIDRLGQLSGVSVATSPEHAVELAKQIDPGADHSGVVMKVAQIALKRISKK